MRGAFEVDLLELAGSGELPLKLENSKGKLYGEIRLSLFSDDEKSAESPARSHLKTPLDEGRVFMNKHVFQEDNLVQFLSHLFTTEPLEREIVQSELENLCNVSRGNNGQKNQILKCVVEIPRPKTQEISVQTDSEPSSETKKSQKPRPCDRKNKHVKVRGVSSKEAPREKSATPVLDSLPEAQLSPSSSSEQELEQLDPLPSEKSSEKSGRRSETPQHTNIFHQLDISETTEGQTETTQSPPLKKRRENPPPVVVKAEPDVETHETQPPVSSHSHAAQYSQNPPVLNPSKRPLSSEDSILLYRQFFLNNPPITSQRFEHQTPAVQQNNSQNSQQPSNANISHHQSVSEADLNIFAPPDASYTVQEPPYSEEPPRIAISNVYSVAHEVQNQNAAPPHSVSQGPTRNLINENPSSSSQNFAPYRPRILAKSTVPRIAPSSKRPSPGVQQSTSSDDYMKKLEEIVHRTSLKFLDTSAETLSEVSSMNSTQDGGFSIYPSDMVTTLAESTPSSSSTPGQFARDHVVYAFTNPYSPGQEIKMARYSSNDGGKCVFVVAFPGRNRYSIPANSSSNYYQVLDGGFSYVFNLEKVLSGEAKVPTVTIFFHDLSATTNSGFPNSEVITLD